MLLLSAAILWDRRKIFVNDPLLKQEACSDKLTLTSLRLEAKPTFGANALETGSGGLTKYNRRVRQLPKTHWLDAANVGRSTPAALHVEQVYPLIVTAHGHGSRQMCRMDKFGF